MIADNLAHVRGRIATACERAGRDVRSVTLLAVGKTFPAAAIREAQAAGQRAFGENYVQEALAKIESLADLRHDLAWHLIGPLQANKTRAVAEAFDWVHTIDRAKTAERLSAQRPGSLPPLQVCVQVNIDGAASKGGVAPDEARALARLVASLPRLRLRGLMAVPEPAETEEGRRAPHRALRELFESLRADGLDLDTLSAGMSDDLESAVAEGATLLRVGSAIFGERAPAGAPLRTLGR